MFYITNTEKLLRYQFGGRGFHLLAVRRYKAANA